MKKAEEIAKELNIKYCFPKKTKGGDVKYHCFENHYGCDFVVLPNELNVESVRKILQHSDETHKTTMLHDNDHKIISEINEKIKECELKLKELSLLQDQECCDSIKKGSLSAEEFAIQNQLLAYLECYSIVEKAMV